MKKQFVLIRVNNDPSDVHAGETISKALDLAMPDAGSHDEWSLVNAEDAGFARLVDPGTWGEMEWNRNETMLRTCLGQRIDDPRESGFGEWCEV